VGDFDVSEIRSLTEHLLKGWNSPVSFERIAMPYKPVKPDVKVMNTPDKTNSLFAMGTTLEIRDDDPDYPALMMGNYLLGGNPNSRMFNRLRQKEGLSYGCGSQVQAGSLDRSGVFIAFGICAPQNCEKAVTCAREEIERLLKEGITQKELDEGRKGYFEQFKVRLSNDGMVAGMLARQEYLGRTMKFTEDELEKIRRLTADDVNKVLRKYLSVDKLFVIRAGDFEKHAGSRDEPKKSGDDETRGGRPEGYRKAG
jgi:zinc protease